jgi:hypothetical protein
MRGLPLERNAVAGLRPRCSGIAKMDFYVPKAGERRDLIAYFKLIDMGS